jgi:hypothetical protein
MNKLFGTKKKEAPKVAAPTLTETSEKVNSISYSSNNMLPHHLNLP